jgi:hypothetical protein
MGRKGSETIQLRLEGRLAITLLSVASNELKIWYMQYIKYGGPG